ncbi:MAG: glycoside hydrolase family 28 protein [Butyrivibrio sp.]|nr:glycoside hydrolase family 28 protein [Butyrivibrio sp.]
MKFEVIDTEPRNITVELDNTECFMPAEAVKVMVNDIEYHAENRNVFSIGGLEPDKEYEVSIIDHEGICERKVIKTSYESVLLDVSEFGAVGDGKNDDTAYIQAAISSCPLDGTVYLGKGTFLSGPLFLKSGVHIWIDKGATLLGKTDRQSYPILPGMTLYTDETAEFNLGTWEGNPLSCFAALITGINVHDVKIFGEGTIDGNAQSGDWWINPKEKAGAWRPRLIFLKECSNVTVQGITVQNSPSWTIHPYYSEAINLIGLSIKNPDNSPNTDGIDPESCSDVNIIGTTISVGDDCIAIKSGKYYMALRHYKNTSNITVRNCRLNRGHGSVTVGSECAGGVNGVKVTRCLFDSTDRGLRIKTRRGRGEKSILQNILFENIKMENVRMPFTINMFYFCDPDGHSEYCQSKEFMEVNEMTPSIKDITARNIECAGVDVCLITVYGLPESKVEEVTLENIKAIYMDEKDRAPEVPVMMDGIDKMSGRGIFVRNTKKLVIRDVEVTGTVDSEPDISETDICDIENVKLG